MVNKVKVLDTFNRLILIHFIKFFLFKFLLKIENIIKSNGRKTARKLINNIGTIEN